MSGLGGRPSRQAIKRDVFAYLGGRVVGRRRAMRMSVTSGGDEMIDPEAMSSISAVARSAAQRAPDKICNRFEGRDTTFKEFD